MDKLEKIIKGYDICLKNFEHSLKEERLNAYVTDNETELGGKEFIYDSWVKFGACFTWVCHPVMSYKMLKLGYKVLKSPKK